MENVGSPADLDLYGFADMKAGIGQKGLSFAKLYNPKRIAFSLIMHYAFCILHYFINGL